MAEEVFEIQGRDPLIEVAIALEKAARSDDYFVKRNLYPNVDFYSGALRLLVPSFQIISYLTGMLVPLYAPQRQIFVADRCS